VVDDVSGVKEGAAFSETYDVTLDKLPLAPGGDYRVLKIPFLMPDDEAYSLGGSGHLTITLDAPAVMKINTAGSGFAFALPSPDPAGAGGSKRWDFMEFNCAMQAVHGKNICWVNTTNVDFFSLGLTIKGRNAQEEMQLFGLDLSRRDPVTRTLNALKALTGDYAEGLTTTTEGAFLRFLSPQMFFDKLEATALDAAIVSGFTLYQTKLIEFKVNATQYSAQTNPAGDKLEFTKPVSFSIAKPSSFDVVAAKGSLDVAGKDPDRQDGIKFVVAAFNRGIFQNTGLWYQPTEWYPEGGVFNQYSAVLHENFIDEAAYGFSFDDVPSGGVTSDPSMVRAHP
jgi:hypothetical protein